MGRDFYQILNIPRNANADEIKKGYRILAIKHHPDKNPEKTEEAKQKFLEINEAYEVLSDPNKKTIYDLHGEEGLKQQAGSGNMTQNHAQQIFNMFFGGNNPLNMFGSMMGSGLQFAFTSQGSTVQDFTGGGNDIFMQRMRVKDPPIMKELYISLNDFYNGAQKQLKIERFETNEQTGEKFPLESNITLNIRPGLPEGVNMNFEGMGDLIPGHIPADLVYILKAIPQPPFERQNAKLIYKYKLTLKEMLEGLTISIPTLDGSGILYEQKVVGVVNPQTPIIVANKGFVVTDMRHPKRGQRDDLVILFDTTSWTKDQNDLDLKAYVSAYNV